MAHGKLRYDPRTRRVQFLGAIRLPDPRLDDLPSDLRAALEKAPHEANVDAQGFPPKFVLAGSVPSAAPARAVAFTKADHTVKANIPTLVLDPPPQRSPTLQVTDPALGLSVGNGLSQPAQGLHPGLKLVQFGANVPEIGSQPPDINRNPYNFVAFGGTSPWLEKAPHQDHASWKPDRFHGVIEFDAETLTPLFIPEGFPFKPEGRDQEAAFRKTPRHFFRLPDATGTVRYAIPGASLKGVLRSAVEALSNSRCGELNEEFYSRPIPYRRRVFQNVGVLARKPAGGWEVLGVDLLYIDRRDWPGGFRPPAASEKFRFDIRDDRFKKFAVPGTAHEASASEVKRYRANLLYAPAPNHRYTHVVVRANGRRFDLDPAVVATYESNLEHPHYDAHRKRYGSDPKHYAQPLDERLALQEGDVVFFSLTSARRIDSFGKNVNYIWPSRYSVKQLVERFFPPKLNSLENELSLAELMFGFSAPHSQDGSASHPYRGKVRIETCWGPQALPHADELKSPQHLQLRLAPLTAPATRAKSRPLYLEARKDGSSSDYNDSPTMSGRKFYWHQRAGAGVWAKHLFDPALHAEVEPQCPPPLVTLAAGAAFSGRIHFDNLSGIELGCLLYALEGSSGRHALKIGKGKPRGLGSLQVHVKALRTVDPTAFYNSLTDTPQVTLQPESFRSAFRQWVIGKGGEGLLNDFDQLHCLPSTNSIRYYPINFSDYGWLPKPNVNPDQPNSGATPPALRRARHLKLE